MTYLAGAAKVVTSTNAIDNMLERIMLTIVYSVKGRDDDYDASLGMQ